MKVVKKEKGSALSTQIVTLRLPVSLVERLDKAAIRSKISRGKLIHGIIRQAIDDPNFIVKIEE